MLRPVTTGIQQWRRLVGVNWVCGVGGRRATMGLGRGRGGGGGGPQTFSKVCYRHCPRTYLLDEISISHSHCRFPTARCLIFRAYLSSPLNTSATYAAALPTACLIQSPSLTVTAAPTTRCLLFRAYLFFPLNTSATFAAASTLRSACPSKHTCLTAPHPLLSLQAR